MHWLKKHIFGITQLVYELKTPFIRSGSPKQTALSITLGFSIGLFPVIGLTTILCVLAGMLFRTNHLITVAVNFMVAPLQILLIYPFMRTGQLLFFTESLRPPLSFEELFLLVEHFSNWFLLLKSLAGGILVWGIFSGLIGPLLYSVIVRKLSKLKLQDQ